MNPLKPLTPIAVAALAATALVLSGCAGSSSARLDSPAQPSIFETGVAEFPAPVDPLTAAETAAVPASAPASLTPEATTVSQFPEPVRQTISEHVASAEIRRVAIGRDESIGLRTYEVAGIHGGREFALLVAEDGGLLGKELGQ